MKYPTLAFLLATLLFFPGCSGNKKQASFESASVIPKEQKFSSKDPFRKGVVESQFFNISGNHDTVVEGKMGTIITIPTCAFTTKEGQPVIGPIEVELAEALTLDQMLLSNLTTFSNGMPLQSGGMVFLNATSKGEPLLVNQDKPLYIEIPTGNKKPGMMAYEGQRDENGNMNWINPQVIENFLLPVDLNSLDFLPEGFSLEVDKGLPFRSYTNPSQRLTDSLYYSLSLFLAPSELVPKGLPSTDYNEPYANKNAQVVKGKYTSGSYAVNPKSLADALGKKDTSKLETTNNHPCGIDPARIKVIRSNAFENTLVSTREFEARMRYIHKSCRNDILELYVNNLDKNLWEIDEMAATKLGTDSLASRFRQFASLKLTKIKNAFIHADALRRFYVGRLNQVNSELAGVKKKQEKALDREKENIEYMAEKYKKILWKREKYRMEKYGFNWSKTGWVNVDNGTRPKEWEEKRLEIIVDKGKEYDAVYTYFVYTSIKSLYRLNTEDNEHFFTGNSDAKTIPVPKHKQAVLIAVAYKNEVPYLGVKEFDTDQEVLTIFMEKSSKDGISKAIAPFDDYLTENKIDVDLGYQILFTKEKKRQAQLMEEAQFIQKLWYKANPCCPEPKPANGEQLFKSNCATCHKANDQKLTGPGLKGATSTYSMDWIIRFTHNSAAMLKGGDPLAKQIYDENNSTCMPAFKLSDQEIRSIFNYVDSLNLGKSK